MSERRFDHASFRTLICDEPRPGVARITLNRPAQMNAYTFEMTQDLLSAVAAYRDDDSLKALILTGAGTRAFCTGGDLSGEGAEHAKKVAGEILGSGREMRDGMQAVVRALVRLDKPSLAVVRGYAVAGGLALALACDFRFAARSAKLGDTSHKAGLLPDEGGAWLFPRAMGLDKALKMSLMSEIYPAEKAMTLGLVTEVYEDDALDAAALAFAEALTTKAPLSVRLTKMMMARASEATLEASFEAAQVAVMITNPSHDAREGVAAFRDKRPPVFTGR
eukprot:gene17805-18026_t